MFVKMALFLKLLGRSKIAWFRVALFFIGRRGCLDQKALCALLFLSERLLLLINQKREREREREKMIVKMALL